MKHALAFIFCLAAARVAAAQDHVTTPPPDGEAALEKKLEKKLEEKLDKKIDEKLAERKAGQQEEKQADKQDPAAPPKPGQEKAGKGEWWERIKLWGFIDFDYRDPESDPSPGDADGSYLPHHTNLGLDAFITGEWEVGVLLEYLRGTGGVTAQYARARWKWMPEFNVEAGIIQGLRSAINTDSICNTIYRDLVDGPLVSSTAGPVVRDAGIGIYGRFAKVGPGTLGYKLQLTEGLKGLSETGATAINRSTGVSGAAASGSVLGTSNFQDINNSITVGLRPEYALFDGGLSFGISAMQGKYDERQDNDFTTIMFDVNFNGAIVAESMAEGFMRDVLKLLVFRFEWDKTKLDTDAFATAAGVPDDLDGWYVELGVHWHIQAVRNLLPVLKDAAFGVAVRYDTVDLDGAEFKRITVGFQIRPTNFTVLKFDREFNKESGTALDVDNDTWKFSFGIIFVY